MGDLLVQRTEVTAATEPAGVRVGRRWPALLVLAMLPLLAVAGTATAAPARAPGAVKLAGTIVLSSAGSGAVAGYLPRTVHLTVDDVTVTGDGRIVGLVIHRDGGPGRLTGAFVRVGLCTTRGCRPDPGVLAAGFIGDGGNMSDATLGAGWYHLYLLADGAPARATVHFPGSRATETVTRLARAATTFAAPKPALGLSPQVYAAGTAGSVPAAGAAIVVVQWVLQPTQQEGSLAGTCIYDGPPQTRPELAYQAGCPGSNGAIGTPFITGNLPVSSNGGYASPTVSVLVGPRGRWGLVT